MVLSRVPQGIEQRDGVKTVLSRYATLIKFKNFRQSGYPIEKSDLTYVEDHDANCR